MTKMQKIWIVALGGALAGAPLRAQPPAPVGGATGQGTDASSMTAAELEQKIGGRTTLELSFHGLAAAEAAAALSKASGLRFGRELKSAWGNVSATSPDAKPEPILYNAAVPKMDFWPAVRLWSQAEAARVEREAAAQVLAGQKDAAPQRLVTAPGEEADPEAMRARQAQLIEEWSKRQAQRSARLNLLRAGVSVGFDSSAKSWGLIARDQITSGRAVNAWPCLVLATGFRRSQSLSIQEDAPKVQGQDKDKGPAQGAAPTVIIRDAASSGAAPEAVEGGQLTDSLLLDLVVYLEPKLQSRGRAQVQVTEARDDAGEDLLPKPGTSRAWALPSFSPSQVAPSVYGYGKVSPVQLAPRQSKGKKLAALRGVVSIRYPMQLTEHEFTDFSGPQGFSVNTNDLPAQGQFQLTRSANGQWAYQASATLQSNRGGREVQDPNRILSGGTASEGIIGYWLLPYSQYTFTDSEGRSWRARPNTGIVATLKGPDGRPIPITSPPTPPPDDFTYTENRSGTLELAAAPGAPPLTPEEMAKVRFTKASFTTESDWRTLEVPFEFHDLPLPPR